MPRPTPNNSYCFLTTATREHRKLLNTNERKSILLRQIAKVQCKINIKFYAYVILNNHYHCLFYLKNGKDLGKVVQIINGGSSFLINKLDHANRSVWDHYWTKVIIDKIMFYKILGYIIGNPIKHKLFKHFKDLNNYSYSSYNQTANKYGDKYTQALVINSIKLSIEDIAAYNKLAKAR